MANKIIINIDTEENWAKALNFIPKKGEVVAYDCKPPRIKIGDGINKVMDLPFIGKFQFNIEDDILKLE